MDCCNSIFSFLGNYGGGIVDVALRKWNGTAMGKIMGQTDGVWASVASADGGLVASIGMHVS